MQEQLSDVERIQKQRELVEAMGRLTNREAAQRFLVGL
jgi:hypothetical protein